MSRPLFYLICLTGLVSCKSHSYYISRIYLTRSPWELEAVKINGKFFTTGLEGLNEIGIRKKSTDSVDAFLLERARAVDFRYDSVYIFPNNEGSTPAKFVYHLKSKNAIRVEYIESKAELTIAKLRSNRLILKTTIDGSKIEYYLLAVPYYYIDPTL